MRRILCVLLVCALSVALCSCSFDSDHMEETTAVKERVLRMVTYMEPASAQSNVIEFLGLIERFTEQTGIEVSIKTIPWNLLDETVVISSQSGESLGDLFVLSPQRLEYLVNSEALLPLDDYFDATFDRDEFLPYVLESGTSSFDGRLYLMLQSLHTRGLWYNKNYVEKAPETLDELLEISRQVMQEHEGVYGLGFWGGGHYGSVETAVNMLTWGHGGSLSTADGHACWANDAVAESIRLMYDWVHVYGIAPEICLSTAEAKDVQEMFYKGELAMIMDGCFTFSYSSNDDYGFAPMPGVDGAAPNFSNGWSLGIAANAAEPDLAWEFIRWFESCDVQVEYALVDGTLPTRKDALADARIQEYELMRAFAENQARYGRKMDLFIYYSEAMEALTSVACQYYLDPEMDLMAALDESMKLYNQKFHS